MVITRISVDGIDYLVEIKYEGDVIHVYDTEGNPVGSAEYDHAVEAVSYDYYNQECGKLEEFGGSSTDLFHNYEPREVAVWLCSTHPEN